MWCKHFVIALCVAAMVLSSAVSPVSVRALAPDSLFSKKAVSSKEEKSVGAMKVMGPPMSGSVLKQLKANEKRWRAAARKQARPETYPIAVRDRYRRLKQIDIAAKVIFVDNLPQGVTAWHFRESPDSPDSPLVVVVNSKIPDNVKRAGKEKVYLDEIIYHQNFKDGLMQKGIDPREAHVIAWASQILALAEQDKLIVCHNAFLDEMPAERLQDIISEYRKKQRDVFHKTTLSSHSGILSELFGKYAQVRVIEYEGRLVRKALLTLFTRDRDYVRQYIDGGDNEKRVERELNKMTDVQKKKLIADVSRLEGVRIKDERGLRKVLSSWLDMGQAARALGIDRSAVSRRKDEGDLRSFVALGDKRKLYYYHPVKILKEYVDYEENMSRTLRERQLRGAIRSLSSNDPDEYLKLVGLIREETGMEPGSPDETWEICKTWEYLSSFADRQGWSYKKVKDYIGAFNIKTFEIKPFGKKFYVTLVPPSSVAALDKERRSLLDRAEKWHYDAFNEKIKLSDMDDLYAWTTLEELPVIFPFLTDDMAYSLVQSRKNAFNVKTKGLMKQKLYIPPLEIERMQKEVVAWAGEEKVFELMREYDVLPAGAEREKLDFDTANNAVVKINDEWLGIPEYVQKTGLPDPTVRKMIARGEIRALPFSAFMTTVDYFIPSEYLNKPAALDEPELLKAKKFLEEECGVAVPSLDKVRGLLEENCVTSSYVSGALGTPRLGWVHKKPRTETLQFKGDVAANVYWFKKDAEDFIRKQWEEFERVKKEISIVSDVSHIKDIKGLVEYLNREWKTIKQLSKELGVSEIAAYKAIRRGSIYSVNINFAGFPTRTYIPPDIDTISGVRRVTVFERNFDEMEELLDGFFRQALMRMPIELLRGRIQHLKSILPQYVRRGMFQIVGRRKPQTPQEGAEYDRWEARLKEYAGNLLSKKMFLEAEGDPGKVLSQLEDLSKWIGNAAKVKTISDNEVKEYSDLKEIIDGIAVTLRRISMVKDQVRKYKPRDNQLYSIAKILEQKRALLSSDAQTGKSFEALMGGLLAYEGKGAQKTLIICKNDAMGKWEEEIGTHIGPDAEYVIIDAAKKEPMEVQLKKAGASSVKYVIMNYNTCRDRIGLVKELGADYTVLDEAHHIGKPYGKHALRDAVFQLGSEYRVLLSATPIHNHRPEELLPLLYWLDPGEAENFAGYRREFDRGVTGLLKINVLWRNIMTRFTRDEIDKEGARLEMITEDVPMTPVQSAAYRRVAEDFDDWYNETFGLDKRAQSLSKRQTNSVFNELFRLREAACMVRLRNDTEIVLLELGDDGGIVQIGTSDTGNSIKLNEEAYIVEEDPAGKYFLRNERGKAALMTGEIALVGVRPYMVYSREKALHSNKIDALVRYILRPEELQKFSADKRNLMDLMDTGERVIIFTESLAVLDAISRLDPRIRCIHGDVPRGRRGKYLAEFNSGNGPRIIAATRGTISESISLPRATMVIDMDIPYTISRRDQGDERVLHPAQKLPKVPVVFFASEGTIDEGLAQYLEAKKPIIDALMSEDSLDARELIDGLLKKIRIERSLPVDITAERLPEKEKEVLSVSSQDWIDVEAVVGKKGIEWIEDPYIEMGRGLTKDETRKLILLYRGGNGAALETLIKFNKRFVREIVNKYVGRNKRLKSWEEDLYAEGIMGLIHAIDKFDVSQDFALTTYGGWWIRQRIELFIINSTTTIRLPVYIVEKYSALSKIELRYLEESGRLAESYEDIVKFDPMFKLTKAQYELLKKTRSEGEGKVVSLDKVLNVQEEDGSLYDVVAGMGHKEMEMRLRDMDLIRNLDAAIVKLAGHSDIKRRQHLYRDIKLLCLRLGYDFENRKIVEPQTLKEVGQRFGITRERVRQITDLKLVPILREILAEMGWDVHFIEEGKGRAGLLCPVSKAMPKSGQLKPSAEVESAA